MTLPFFCTFLSVIVGSVGSFGLQIRRIVGDIRKKVILILFVNSNVGQDILPFSISSLHRLFWLCRSGFSAFGPDPLLIESSQDLLLLPNREVSIVGVLLPIGLVDEGH